MSVEFRYYHNNAKMGRCTSNVLECVGVLAKSMLRAYHPTNICMLSL